MRRQISMSKSSRLSFWLLCTLFLLLDAPWVSADPPDWAPAHGYRDKQHRHHERDDDDDERDRDRVVTREDVGIVTGTCNREAIGTVLGGVVGGAVGSRIGQDQGNQKAGLVLGAIVGAVIGQSIGKQMDDADKQCTVQVLEQARNGQAVAWTNTQSGVAYRLTPIATFERNGQMCRKYRSLITAGGRREQTNKLACRATDGTWRVDHTD